MSSIIRKFTNRLKAIVIAGAVVTSLVSGSVADVSAAPKKQSQFTVVIDAGHGGHDHGAIDNGTREKDINLGVATKLAELLKKKMKNVKVVLTRDDDTFISLQERANIANKNKGNLFISIHTNSVDKSNPNRKKVSGATVYALGPQKDANNLKVAQRENSVIELEDNYHQKYSGFDPSKDESYIIFEMAQKKNLGQSLKFADKAQKELVKTAGRADRGVKQAGFWVLWATSMPAVLVELDFICNPTEAKFISSESGQEKLAAALFNAVKDYVQVTNNKTAQYDANGSAEVRLEEMAKAESETDTDSGHTANDGNEGVGVLMASTETKRAERNPHATVQAKKAYGPRKRRSSASRQASNERNVETKDIQIKDETEYLVKQEEAPKEIKPSVQEEEKSKDKGKKKNKKAKEKKVKKADAKKSDSKKGKDKVNDSKKGNSKTFVVKSSSKTDVYTDFRNKQQGKNTNDAQVKAKQTKATEVKTTEAADKKVPKEMVYKILLVSSDKELDANDPAFAGLKPSGVYIENNKYKYTYGSSKNRREIENKLLEVKSLLPDAVIVVRAE